MSLPIRLRTAAEQDLVDHAEFIRRTSLEGALRFLVAADAALSLLSRVPEMGGNCQFSNPAHAGLRVWQIKGFLNHLIFYRCTADEIEVIRILHGARDLGAVFGSAEE